MSKRKQVLLRLPPALVEEMNRWAKDDLRSLNAQIEYVLRESLRKYRKLDTGDTELNLPGESTIPAQDVVNNKHL